MQLFVIVYIEDIRIQPLLHALRIFIVTSFNAQNLFISLSHKK